MWMMLGVGFWNHRVCFPVNCFFESFFSNDVSSSLPWFKAVWKVPIPKKSSIFYMVAGSGQVTHL